MGDTRLCVGPGACSGAQRCEDDARWSSCDCGSETSRGGSSAAGSAGATEADAGGAGADSGAGDTAGEAGSAGAEAAAGSNGMLQGGSGGVGGSGNAEQGGSAGKAGSDGSQQLDEPCPTGVISADCSGQCATKPGTCDSDCTTYSMQFSLSEPGVFARTPSHPGSVCSCGSKSTAYSMGFSYKPTKSTGYYYFCVQAPWHLSNFDGACVVANPTDCIDLNVGPKTFSVWTADPDAPAINLTALVDANP